MALGWVNLVNIDERGIMRKLLTVLSITVFSLFYASVGFALEYRILAGLSAISHSFYEFDDYRDEGGAIVLSGVTSTENISILGGSEAFVEVFLNDIISVGYRNQKLQGKVSQFSNDGVIRRQLNLENQIYYLSLSTYFRDSNYWRVGTLFGQGTSTYTYKATWNRTTTSSVTPDIFEEEVSVTGEMTMGGFYLDWGVDASGGRVGVNFVLSQYDSIEAQTYLTAGKPNTAGQQYYLSFRYAF